MNEARRNQLHQLCIATAAVICFAIAELTLFVRHYSAELRSTLWTALVLFVLCCITNLVAREVALEEPLQDRHPALQIWLCLSIVALTGVINVLMSGTLANAPSSSSELLQHASGLSHVVGGGWFQFGFYVVFTAAVLISAGADPRGFGLKSKWHSIGPAGFFWLLPTAVLLAMAIGSQRHPIGEVGARLFQNFFQNGFSEEFLFRGALLTRLRLRMPEPAANAIQSILFGLWHFGPNYRGTHDDLAATVSLALAGQAVFGAAMGYLATRLGSIALPTVTHTLFDTWLDVSRW